MVNIEKIKNDLFINRFYKGRMISGSKSYYRNNFPWNKVCFNANIFVNNGNQFEKIWYGDLDITKDGNLLKEIAFNNNVILYVLSEMDGRFGNENTQNVINNKFWDTTENLIIVDEEYIKLKEKELKAKKRKLAKERKEQERKSILLNNSFEIKEIKEILNCKVLKEIKITKKMLDKQFNALIKRNVKYIKTLSIEEAKDYIKRIHTKRDYFSDIFLDYILMKELKLETKNQIKYNNNWTTQFLFDLLKEYDYKFETTIGNKVKKEKLNSYYLCNIDINLANKEKTNISSYKDGIIYILDR